jgi:hypothetical protein
MDRQFYSNFLKRAATIRTEAGAQNNDLITENDLKSLPFSVVRYMRSSRIIGKKKISSMRLMHSGLFRPDANREFMNIQGEYFLTTKKPSFCWYGRISLVPGMTIVAFDSYFNGQGRMIVKALSFVPMIDAQSKEIDVSAFGRCIAEMTMAPSFFLDTERIRWTRSDSSSAACIITDAGLRTEVQLFFRQDGFLEKMVVLRFYDRGKNNLTLEKFIGKVEAYRDYNGVTLASVINGYWALKEGDLHYVHFVIDRVEFE